MSDASLFEAFSEQSKQLTELAQKLATDVVEPIAAAAKPRSGC